MYLGLNLAVFSDRPLNAALDAAVAYDVEAIELNFETTDVLTPLNDYRSAAAIRKLKTKIHDRGLRISAIGNHVDAQLIGGPHHQDTDNICKGDSEEKIAHGKRCLLEVARIASELEVATVVGFTGCEDWSRWFPWPDRTGWERMLAPFVDVWRPLLDELSRLGVRFGHEPHPKQLAFDLESSRLVTDALDAHVAWGFNVDTGNLSLMGVDPAAFVQEFGDKVFHVHAKDFEIVAHNAVRSSRFSSAAWNAKHRGARFRIPGWGQVDWKCFLSELQLSGYKSAISIEHEDPVFSRDEGVRNAVDYLRGLIIREEPVPPWW